MARKILFTLPLALLTLLCLTSVLMQTVDVKAASDKIFEPNVGDWSTLPLAHPKEPALENGNTYVALRSRYSQQETTRSLLPDTDDENWEIVRVKVVRHVEEAGAAPERQVENTSASCSWVGAACVVYDDDSGCKAAFGSSASTALPVAARRYFEYAVGEWVGQLGIGQNIKVLACSAPMSGSTLGATYATGYYDFPGQPVPDTIYPLALARQIAGAELSSEYDGQIVFNSDLQWSYSFSPPSTGTDFVLVALHELGHVFAFRGGANVLGTVGWIGEGDEMFPWSYDRFTEDGYQNSLLNYPQLGTEMYEVLTGGSVWFGGPKAKDANGGSGVRLYAPEPWDEGSSYSHLDQSTYANTINGLMTPQLNTSRSIGPVSIGLARDIGWGAPTGILCREPNHVNPVYNVSMPQWYNMISDVNNDAVSSIWLAPDWSVMVYEDAGISGGKRCITSSDYNLNDNTFDNGRAMDEQISSFVLYHNPACIVDPPTDTTPPTASWVSPSNGQNITSSSVRLEANASDNSSGVKEVRFSAKYNGAWNSLAVDTSSPYVFDWDMCSYGVPDGDVELGLEATDNAGNKYVYSQDPANGGNIHINKSYNCNTPPAQGCAAPGLISPSDGETLGSRTITFRWNPVSGCTFNGYTFRVCTSSDVEALSNCFIDSGEGSTQRTETITDHDNMDLWWGVKAANASAGSSWAVRRFTINPAAANGQWNASYFNTRTCWDDHNNCNGTTFNETLYVPGGGTLIDKNYGSSSPGGSIGSDNWTGRYEGTFNFATGNYVFYADHDDGLKLNIWNYGEHTKDSSGTNSVICNGNGGYFLSGDMPIRLYLREDGGDAKIKLRWSTDTSVCGSGSGGGVTGGSWSADYFNTRTCWDDHNNCNGTTYHDSPSFPGADTLIDKNWGQSSPGNGISQDNWTGRFVGTFNFQPAKYVFYADHDDGLKLQFGGYGEHTKDSSGSNSMICNGADGYSLSGNQQIKLYLREDGGDARVKLRWNTDTTACLPVPSAPAGVVASDGTYSDHIRVTWNAASYATVYEVWRNSTNNSATAAVIHNYVTATSYDDAYIVPGQTYYYWIKAKNSKGTSEFSASDFGFAAVLPPAAPTGVSASDGDYTDTVLVTWLAVPGATGYEVWRNTADSSSNATQIAAAVNGTSYADTTVSIGQTYYYWTKARNVSGAGSFSASDSGFAYVAAPAAPSGVTASDGTYPDGIRVSWLAAAGALSYEIWRNTSDSSGSATLIAVGVDGTEYDDTGTTSDQVYYYWIKATNSGGSSGFGASDSGYSHAPTPAEVADLAVIKSSTGAVLTWSHIDPIVMQYEVYRSEYPYFTPGQGDATTLEPDVPAPAVGVQASFTDATTCSGENTPCFYAVVAVNMYGKPSAASNRVGIVSFTVEPGTDPTGEPDLAAWWQAEGNTLDSANDNDGTLRNGAGYGQGRVGQGFVFDGVDDYLEVPHSASLSPAAFTVEAWVRFDSFYSGNCGSNTIVSKGVDNTAGFYGLHVQDMAYSCSSTTGQHGLVMSMRMQDGSGVTVRGVTVLLANTWYHLAATWDGSMARLYVNGASDGQTGPLTGKTLGSNTQALTIGRHAHTSYPYWVDGVIDEVKIHNRALSETEIRDAYGHD